MKKRTPQGLAIILLLLVIVVANKYCIRKPLPSVSIGVALNIKSHDMNKTLPVDIDSFTRFDKTLYIPPKQFQFNYTFHNLIIDSLSKKILADSMPPSLLKLITQGSDLKLLRDSNVTFSFQYSDSLGHILHKFTFTPTDYK